MNQELFHNAFVFYLSQVDVVYTITVWTNHFDFWKQSVPCSSKSWRRCWTPFESHQLSPIHQDREGAWGQHDPVRLVLLLLCVAELTWSLCELWKDELILSDSCRCSWVRVGLRTAPLYHGHNWIHSELLGLVIFCGCELMRPAGNLQQDTRPQGADWGSCNAKLKPRNPARRTNLSSCSVTKGLWKSTSNVSACSWK